MQRHFARHLLKRLAAFAVAVTLFPVPAFLFSIPVQAAEGDIHTIANDSLRMEIGDLGQIVTMNIQNNPRNRNGAEINFIGSHRSWGDSASQNDAAHQWTGEMIFSTRSAATREGLAGLAFSEVDTNKTLAAGGSTTATNVAANNPYFSKTQTGQAVAMTFNGGDDPAAGNRRMQDFKVDSTFDAATDDGSVVWEITITNKDTENFIEFGDIGLPMTWNNKYSTTADTYNNRLTVHSFAGADSGYYYAIRTSGEGNYMMFTPVPESGARIEYVEHWKRNFNGQSGTIRTAFANWTGDGGGWYPGLSVAYIHSKSIRDRDGASYFKSEDSSSLILAPGESKTYQFKFSAVRAGDNTPGESAADPQNASTSVKERETNQRSILYKEGLIDAIAVPSFQTAINMPAKLDLHYDEAQIRNVVATIQSVYENDPFDTDHIPRANNNLVSNSRGGRGLPGANPGYTRKIELVDTVTDERGEKHHIYDLAFDTIGNNSVRVDYEFFDGTNWVKKLTQFEYNVLTEIDEAIDAHADFMAENQQDTDPNSPEYGIYDDWYLTAGIDTSRSHWMDDWSHDNVDFMVMKNYLNPDPDQLRSLELYLIDFMWERFMKYTQSTFRVSNTLNSSGIYSTSTNPGQRDFSEVMVATAYFNMYRIQKAYPTLIEYRESRLYYLEKAYGIANQLGASTTGFYGEQQIPDIIAALYEEGMTTQADTLKQRFAYTKGRAMAAAAYPYGSEFEYDNTGEEGAYAANKALRTYYPTNDRAAQALTQMEKTDWKTRAMRGLQPTWFHYADPVFRGGESWWNFQYTASLAGYIMDDWLRFQNEHNQYDNVTRAWAERLNYGAKISNFNAINMGQISANSIGSVSWRYTMGKGNFGAQNVNDGGTRLMSNGWNDFSGEADEGIYGSLLSISTDVVTDPVFGLFAYGGTMAKADGVYTVAPRDGIGKRLNFLDEMLYITAESDNYTSARVHSDASRIELSLNNIAGAAHMSKFVFYGLKDGFYSVALDGAPAGQFYVVGGEGTAYVAVDDRQAFNVTFNAIADGSPQAPVVEIVSQFDTPEATKPFYLDGLVYHDGFGEITSYLWETVSAPEGGSMTITPNNIPMPTATATVPGEYTVKLTVVANGNTVSVEKTMTVIPPPPVDPPTIANLGYEIDGNVATISADVTNADRNDRALTYEWTLQSIPEGTSADIGIPPNATEYLTPAGTQGGYFNTKALLTVVRPGTYVVRLTATDGTSSAFQDIQIDFTGDVRMRAISVVTSKNVAPELPATVDVVSDGIYGPRDIAWEAIPEEDYAEVGRFSVDGVVVGTDINITITVYVVENTSGRENYAPIATTDGIYQNVGDMGGYAAMQRTDTPTSSNNAGVQQAWHNWTAPNSGQSLPAWVSYEWSESVLMDAIDVYVFRDNNGNFQPHNFKLQLRDVAGTWYTPRGIDANELGNALNQFNTTTFEPAYITGMRLDMEPMTIGSGIARWWAYGYVGGIVDKAALIQLCDLYPQLNSSVGSRFTNWGASGIAAAYTAANTVRSRPTATQAEVDEAYKALADAMRRLTPAGVPTDQGARPNLAFLGGRDASYTSSWETLTTINNNNTTTANHWGSWGRSSNSEWVSYTWPTGATVTGDNLYIWSDGGGIQIPETILYEYLPLTSDEWVPLLELGTDEINGVHASGSYPNPHSFDETTLRGLRVTFTRVGLGNEGFGLTEWQVFGSLLKEGVRFSYDGDAAEAIIPGATLDIDAMFMTPEEPSITMYCALYADDGRLLQTANTVGTVVDGLLRFDAELAIPEDIGGGASVKVFFWDTETFAPVRAATAF